MMQRKTHTFLTERLSILKKIILFTLLPVFIISCGDSEDGMDGINGVNGLNVLFNVSDEPVGANCTNEGLKVEYGQDVNENDVLDASEVQGTSFICNGAGADQVLVVTVDEPAGENCLDGGVKILVGIDDNANGTLEMEEVDNTSFICNGEISAVQGKTLLILSGDITNEQAEAKIAQEFGPNTQFVSILFTTQLTSVDLSMATNLVEVRIEANEALETVDLSGLITVDDVIDVFENSLTSIDLSSLERSRGISFIESGLTSLDLSSLTRAANVFIRDPDLASLELGLINSNDIAIEDGAFTQLDLSSLVGNEDLEIAIFLDDLNSLDISSVTKAERIDIGGTSLVSLDLSNLTFSRNLGIFGNSQLTSVNMSNLDSVDFRLSINGNQLNVIDLNSLTAVGSIFISGEPSLTDININNVEFLNSIEVTDNPELTDLNFNSLGVTAGEIRISRNSKLSSIDFTSLQAMPSTLTIDQNEALVQLDLSSLSNASTISIRFNDALTSVNLDGLLSIDRLEIAFNNILGMIDLQNLGAIGSISLNSNNLSTIDLDAWTTLLQTGDFIGEFENNNFDSSIVNYILSVLVSINPAITNSSITLTQFNTPAPPTGQGITDKATLEANGNSVSTN